MADDAGIGLRRRRAGQPEEARAPPALGNPAQPLFLRTQSNAEAVLTVSRLYYIISIILASLAIITAQAYSPVKLGGDLSMYADPPVSLAARNSDRKSDTIPELHDISFHWNRVATFIGLGVPFEKLSDEIPEEDEEPLKKEKFPLLRWLLRPDSRVSNHDGKRSSIRPDGFISTYKSFLKCVLDPFFFESSSENLTKLIDKITTSTPRLVVITNLFLAMTFLIHGAIADWFLGSDLRHSNDWASSVGRERLGGFLVFKFLLISAVVAPDTLDLIILLSWYTLLSFLRSLSHLSNGTTRHTIQSGQPPRPGVLVLLVSVLISDCLAAAFCVALFHEVGWKRVMLLTCDCLLLGLDVICHILMHVGQVVEVQHAERIHEFELQQLRIHQRSSVEGAELNEDDIRETQRLEASIAAMGQQHTQRIFVLESAVFGLQLLNHLVTVSHFIHIWCEKGLSLTLLDGVLSLQVHSALSSASKKIAERRDLFRIARDMNGRFDDASDIEIRKATATGDVCCICLGSMTSGNVKKIGCGHLYHTPCLRQVIEKARSMEAARCPLCRASIMDGHHHRGNGRLQGDNTAIGDVDNVSHALASAQVEPTRDADNFAGSQSESPRRGDQVTGSTATSGTGTVIADNNTTNNTAGERALFRFSTEGVFPGWLPLPAFSFEVVRRPLHANDNVGNNTNNESDLGDRPSILRRILLVSGLVPMSAEEESAALEQLMDMFPLYERSDLLHELRRLRSSEAVVESILGGRFAGLARGDQTWQGIGMAR
ncbi:autocrine motility factor receptor [Fistulifera solaris]|uniref:Autocrine motility factor receptor n=1 Tax=Fistulifera solaris TaxID=1519565 RepID=A0A1Z5KN71_FISSO|nr:autocrine motility factor receptor [Fistulifera solaris]|eukprot:GAX27368.1 autocrine motility factor receptor [Fistulifera solaris]